VLVAFRRLLAVVMTTAGLVGGAAVMAPNAGALGWGAIAISQEAGRVGYSKGMNSAVDAERAAIGLCQMRDCRAVVNFSNACGAVAQSSDTYWAWGRDRTGVGAQRSALVSCAQLGPGCRVVGWMCS
jgi:NAD/NADP transhydrogenase alpha subunit